MSKDKRFEELFARVEELRRWSGEDRRALDECRRRREETEARQREGDQAIADLRAIGRILDAAGIPRDAYVSGVRRSSSTLQRFAVLLGAAVVADGRGPVLHEGIRWRVRVERDQVDDTVRVEAPQQLLMELAAAVAEGVR